MKAQTVKLVTFQLGLDIFAADVMAVERVLRYAPPSAVPDVPAWIAGVIEHRGRAVPVVDLRRRVELSDDMITPDTRILVFNTTSGWVAGVVDAVHEVAGVAAGAISPPPALFRGLSAEFVCGTAKVNGQLVIVLDVERILTTTDRIVFEQAVQDTAATPRG